MTEEEKKKEEWNPIKVGENITNGSTTSKTIVKGDVTGWDKPVEYNFQAPERKERTYDFSNGFWNAIKPKEPEFDKERAEHLKRVARINAFGDFMKHLGAFAGGGYAPTQKREENKNVLRAFQELDKMRDLYDARMDKYNDRKFSTQLQDLIYQRNRDDRDYEREYQSKENAAMRDWQVRNGIRANKENAYWKGNMSQKNTQYSDAEQFKNKDLLMSELEARKRKGAGSGKDENFYAYISGVGDLAVNKSAQVQIGTRIKDAMLKAGRINEKDAAGLMAALAGTGSRNAFQSLLGYMRYPDVWEACKQFIGHGMELSNAETAGIPTDNDVVPKPKPNRNSKPSALPS